MGRKNLFSLHYNRQQRTIILKEQRLQDDNRLKKAKSTFQYWSELRQLWIKACNLHDIRLLSLFWGLRLISLRELYLTNNRITSLGTRVLAQTEMSNLQILYLNENYIGDAGIKWLNKGSWQLKCIQISHNLITVEGMRELYKGNWQNTHYAYFDENELQLSEFLSVCKCYDMNKQLVQSIIFSPSNEAEPQVWKQITMYLIDQDFDVDLVEMPKN